MIDGEFRGWTLTRFVNAVRVSLPWLRQLLEFGAKTVFYFARFLWGNIHGISGAPTPSKWGLILSRLGRKKALTLSDFPEKADIWENCVRVHARSGVWPISFSYPRPAVERSSSVKGFICPIFPGHRYAFTDEPAYLKNYARFAFALTHKKGGWDCFRHLEIMYSGAVPYMPDASFVPEFTMVHYPKKFLAEVAAGLRHSQVVISSDTQKKLARYFNDNLTSAAMALYMLRAAEVDDDAKVLFVDEATVAKPDYQSIFTLIGLKQTLGKRISVAFPLDYIYEDWAGDTATLYGRGFGYTRVLEPSLKNPNEVSGELLDLSAPSLASFDAVVVGSVTRNYGLADQLLARFPASKTIWIHGEDQGPSVSDTATFRAKGVTAFVRELGTKG